MGRKALYDFGSFQVGEKRTWQGKHKSIAVCACVYGKKHKMKFSVNKISGLSGTENGEQDAEGVEITRTA